MDERLLKAKSIVFDIGNVLLRFQTEKVCALFPEVMRQAMHRAMFLPENGKTRWDSFDLGIPENEVIARDMAQAASFPDAAPLILDVLEKFHLTMEEMPLYRQLPRLKEMGKRIYALTNYPEPSFSCALAHFENLGLMEGILVSSRIKIKKPDVRIFQLMAEKYALVPEETLFIDDREDNILGAAKAGFQTWHYVE